MNVLCDVGCGVVVCCGVWLGLVKGDVFVSGGEL